MGLVRLVNWNKVKYSINSNEPQEVKRVKQKVSCVIGKVSWQKRFKMRIKLLFKQIRKGFNN